MAAWSFWPGPLAACTADLPLRFVVQSEPKRVPESHQCPLHGIGLGFLEGGFMGLAQVHVDAMAGTAALANQGCQPTGGDGDAHTGGVGDAPARLLVPADGAFGLGDAAHGDGLALPAVKTKNPVGLGDGEPALDIRHLPATLLALADVGPIEGGGEGGELLGGEAWGLNRDSGRHCFWRGWWSSCLGSISGADQLQG